MRALCGRITRAGFTYLGALGYTVMGALRPCLPSDLPSFTIKITIELAENS